MFWHDLISDDVQNAGDHHPSIKQDQLVSVLPPTQVWDDAIRQHWLTRDFLPIAHVALASLGVFGITRQ